MTPHQFDVHLRAIPASERVAAIEARDAAIRADQMRQDSEIARSLIIAADGPVGNDQIAAEIERRAGIGKEKGDE